MEITTAILWPASVALGLCIGYRIGKKKRVTEQEVTEERVTQKKVTGVKSEMPAKQCFIQNMGSFSPLLDGLHQGKMDSEKWMETIVSVGNEELLGYWKKIKNNASSWIMILQMWGISYDQCVSFTCADYYKSLYMLQNGGQLENGKKYKVVSPCWIFTESLENGHSQKKVINKGIVSEL